MRPELPREGIESPAADCSNEKSTYIGNVDYETTEQESLEHLSVSGAVKRVKIMKNKVSGAPRALHTWSAQSVVSDLDGSLLRNQGLRVSFKQSNNTTERRILGPGKGVKSNGQRKGNMNTFGPMRRDMRHGQ